jgi:hypothetical protein
MVRLREASTRVYFLAYSSALFPHESKFDHLGQFLTDVALLLLGLDVIRCAPPSCHSTLGDLLLLPEISDED